MDLRPLDDDYSPYEDEEIIEGGPSTLKRLLGIAMVAMVVVTGVTIAANINLNSGIKVEMGTGSTGTALCDQSLQVTPLSGFDNTTTPTSITNPSVNGQQVAGTFTSDAVGAGQKPINLFQRACRVRQVSRCNSHAYSHSAKLAGEFPNNDYAK